MTFDIKKYGVHIAAVAIFIITAILYFYPQFQGKKIPQGDIRQYMGMSQEVREFEAATGEHSLWTNSMFGGMPTYQISARHESNQLNKVVSISKLNFKLPAGQFIAAMIGFYILMLLLGVNPWLGIIGAIAFALSTNNLVLYEAGHESKLKAISYLPLVTAGLMLAFRNKYVLGGLVFALGLGLDLTVNHIQMTYYFFMTVLIFGVAQGIKAFKENELPQFGKAVASLTVGGLIAIGCVASNLWVTYDYSKDTMRGQPILETTGEAVDENNSSEVDGLAWNYAMQWSNGNIDVMASFIPGVAGGGSQEPVSKSTELYRLFSRGASGGAPIKLPLYWGNLTFTSGPIYFGAVMILFFVMGLFLVKGPVKWWLSLGVLLTIMLSYGYNLETFNRFIFDYFPLYNKFRTPNSVLSVTALLIPLLGILALDQIVSGKASKEDIMTSLKIGGGVLAAIALFFALMGGSFFDFQHANDASTFAQMSGSNDPAVIAEVSAKLLNPFIDARKDLMQSDAWRSLLLVVASGLAVYFFQVRKKQTSIFLGIIAALTLYDVVGVGQRYVNEHDFQPAREVAKQHQELPVNTAILKDKDLGYRVLDLRGNAFQSADASFYHRSIGGNHAAKLQRYQDLIERRIQLEMQKFREISKTATNDSLLQAGMSNLTTLNMLNTRYLIYDNNQAPLRNPAAYGPAWLVSDFQMVASNNAEIDALNTINPLQTAVVHEEFSDYMAGKQPNGQGSISLTDYEPNRLTYQVNAQGDQFAVFSEIWFGPDKGWQAYVDDEPVDFIRVNYALRGMNVPSGQHEIVFEFEPQNFRTGSMISFIFSMLLLLGLLGYAYYWFKNREPIIEEDPEPVKPKRTVTKTKRKKKK